MNNRICTGPCGRTYQATTEFFYKNVKCKLGLATYCKSCHKTTARLGLTPAAKRRAARRYELKRYGVTPEQYAAMMNSQNGVCAICNEAEARIRSTDGKPYDLHVDHDHRSGAVRGLLCYRCNTGLGQFRDKSELLLAAVRYLGGAQ